MTNNHAPKTSSGFLTKDKGPGTKDKLSPFLACLAFLAGPGWGLDYHKPLTFEDRVKAQEAIERVYYNHRIWPKENPGPKPSFEQMVTREQLEVKVEDYCKRSAAIDKYWKRPLVGGQLQAEMDRIARNTKDPTTLRELFEALDNDPYLIAECLARHAILNRLGDINRYVANRMDGYLLKQIMEDENYHYHLPPIIAKSTLAGSGEWQASAINEAIDGRQFHSAVWTGSEMIIWGGAVGIVGRDTGGRYDPMTDSWALIPVSVDSPSARDSHTAVWTGIEMIIFGGERQPPGSIELLNSGGRYNPVTNSWIPISILGDCPASRKWHCAIWTGMTMIVWGGQIKDGKYYKESNTGGIFDPQTDSWMSTSIGANCPVARIVHTAVWNGSELIVWGGKDSKSDLNTGGRFSPGANTWLPTSTSSNCPSVRSGHTAVWTGEEMIVWGGSDTNTGGRYDPRADTWTATSISANCPSRRGGHAAVWTGIEMIIWGNGGSGLETTGGRYSPFNDSWLPTSTGAICPMSRGGSSVVWTGVEIIVWGGRSETNLNDGALFIPAIDAWSHLAGGDHTPAARYDHTAIWSGQEMIVWGGYLSNDQMTNTGGRYSPSGNTWRPTNLAGICPSPRIDHSAVWTGSEMIIWGGADGPNVLNSGGRYDPLTDVWRSISATDQIPVGRMWHSTVWTGHEMIVWGGWLDQAGLSNSGERYNPLSDSWQSISSGQNCPKARQGHSALWTGSDMIIWGGDDGYEILAGARYDPAGDRWLSISNAVDAIDPRYGHSAVWTGEEMIIWGGSAGEEALRSGSRYSPISDRWDAISINEYCPSARSGHSAIWTGSAMIIWGGGANSSGGIYEPNISHARPVENPSD